MAIGDAIASAVVSSAPTRAKGRPTPGLAYELLFALLRSHRRRALTVSPQRQANVAYASALLETEIGQRNARKDSQEGTARWIVATTGVVVTLLLGLAKDEGVFSSSAPIVGRFALVATAVVGSLGAGCAIACLWPRKYERLGASGLVHLNDEDFLDLPEHEVVGRIVASRIGIVTNMDELHEEKAKWLKRSFRLLSLTFVGLAVQGAVLATDPPRAPSTPLPKVHQSGEATQAKSTAAPSAR